jgi:glycosyltransferase involved in cell wall biosynthesis
MTADITGRPPTLSAIVITRNEAANIGACLATLAFCDERIVVDSGSEDDTVAIARSHGATVTVHPWQGFGAQKNHALALATGDWVLSIDADERVTPELAQAIRDAIASDRAAGYEMPRLSRFLGREMWHSGWYPDHVLRVFRRGSGRFSDRLVHESVQCDGPVGRLKPPLRHDPVHSIEDSLSRMDRYSTAGAEMLIASGRRVSFASGLMHGFWAFIRTYILQRGFLDGREGLILAIANAEGTYYRYMKAWAKQRSARHEKL